MAADPTREKGADMLADAMLREFEGMTADELREVVEALQAMVVRAAAGPEAEPGECPHCECGRFVKSGRDKRWRGGKVVESTQRYKCLRCGRTFTRRTNSLLALSKLGVETWTRFVELECRRATLAECAAELGVSEPTAHHVRMRLCELMGAAAPDPGCGDGDGCQVDGTYPSESMKGMGRRGAEMPREPHRTGHDVRTRGISDEKVCVLVGVGEGGRDLCEVCDRGRPTDARVRACLEGRVGSGAAVSTDDHQAYARVLPGLGVANHLVFPSDGSAGDGLFRVNAAHQRLKDFLGGFNGVSTRYLQPCCGWHRFLEHVRHAGRDLHAALQDLVARGRYAIRRDRLYREERPFWDHWEGKSPVVDVASLWGQ
jgi:transposase-like protein